MSILNTRPSEPNKDVVLCMLAAAVLGSIVGVGAVLTATATVATALAGGGWAPIGPSRWLWGLFQVLTHPADPGAGLGPPWASALAGHAVSYWTLAGVLLTATSVATAMTIRLAWSWWGPTPPGHASRAQIRAELSVTAARRRARFTRPSLTEPERRAAPADQVGVPMHWGPIGPLCVPHENPTGTLAPTQTGKSRRDLVHKVLAAPGAVLVSTSKPDLLEFTACARARRPDLGPVAVFDVTGSANWPALVRWSPVQGCRDATVAYLRASTMVEAAAARLREMGGNNKVFDARAKVVIAANLQAAALYDRGIGEVAGWAVTKSREPVGWLAETPGFEQLANSLADEMDMVAETSDAVWLSVRRVLEPFMMDSRLLDLCSPRLGTGFDAETFIATGGSLYLVAGESAAGAATPILTALAEHWIETAREMALRSRHRRLDPPATAVLDELTNATPIPSLPSLISDSAGRGVPIHWAAQSAAAVEEAFGQAGARQLFENSTLMSFWGGGKDQRTLEWASILTGHYDRYRYQVQADGVFSPGRTATGTETVPVYRPGDVRMLPRNEVLIIHRALGAIRARTRDVTERPDWPVLSADVDDVRSGRSPVDALGRYRDPSEPVTAPLRLGAPAS